MKKKKTQKNPKIFFYGLFSFFTFSPLTIHVLVYEFKGEVFLTYPHLAIALILYLIWCLGTYFYITYGDSND